LPAGNIEYFQYLMILEIYNRVSSPNTVQRRKADISYQIKLEMATSGVRLGTVDCDRYDKSIST